MNKLFPLVLGTLLFAAVGCTTTAPTKTFQTRSSVAELYRIGGDLKSDRMVSITINDELVVRGKVHAFAEERELSGEYQGKPVSALLKNIRTFNSSYVQAEVTIAGEQAATLTF